MLWKLAAVAVLVLVLATTAWTVVDRRAAQHSRDCLAATRHLDDAEWNRLGCRRGDANRALSAER